MKMDEGSSRDFEDTAKLSSAFQRSEIAEEVVNEPILVGEVDTVQDLIFLLQGVDPLYVRDNNKFPPFSSDVIPILETVSTRLKEFILFKATYTPESFVQRAVYATAETILREYFSYVAEIDASLHQSELVTILQMYKHGLYCQDCISNLDEIVRKSCTLKGGELLSYLHRETRSPHKMRNSIAKRMLEEASVPLYQMIYDWVVRGQFTDPHHDFFLTIKTTPALLETTHIQNNLVPSFLCQIASGIKFIGEAVIFLQDIGCDVNDLTDEMESNKNLFCLDQTENNNFQIFVNQLNNKTHKKTVELLQEKYTPLEHTFLIKQYMLLFRGDFATNLIDSINQTLTCGTMTQADLTSYFRSALNLTNCFTDRLCCRAEEGGVKNIQFDVTISYKLPKPLGLIISQKQVETYNDIFKFLWRVKCLRISINKVFKRMFPFFVSSALIDGIPVFLHRFRIKFVECARFVESLEEYMYVHMQECYDHFEEAWKTANDLYALSSIHGAYVDEIARVLFISSPTISVITTSIINFIFTAIEKLDYFITNVSIEIDRRKGMNRVDRERAEKFNNTVEEMENRVDLELDNYKAFYNHFLSAIDEIDNKQSRFLLRRLNPEIEHEMDINFSFVIDPE
ncbi:gamma-tubulin complex component, putative [Entamoeba invadens IP1]|uniref:gamma-tubulin complex component, putative n=1 Tax=Entamoeba invadens IP1 TaxID=370355 RepID=UPI0002C3DE82|nr:gamma-tubulin complex component, putative [Entamoeba invadens IP1]ELP93297.1 gamma-tubulin complex component, putative [Entamoeba invadens IP1]|eukprot:XP_004260068.1 gamma-tubulin complex component, putative [Entamoeba invadens IP1]